MRGVIQFLFYSFLVWVGVFAVFGLGTIIIGN